MNTNLAGPAGFYQNGPRYGLGLPPRANSGVDGKMNGLHGPKHKRGDMDRECRLTISFVDVNDCMDVAIMKGKAMIFLH